MQSRIKLFTLKAECIEQEHLAFQVNIHAGNAPLAWRELGLGDP